MGLGLVLAYRLSVEIYDRREYSRFEKERQQLNWKEVRPAPVAWAGLPLQAPPAAYPGPVELASQDRDGESLSFPFNVFSHRTTILCTKVQSPPLSTPASKTPDPGS